MKYTLTVTFTDGTTETYLEVSIHSLEGGFWKIMHKQGTTWLNASSVRRIDRPLDEEV